jgi:hypothetical protein
MQKMKKNEKFRVKDEDNVKEKDKGEKYVLKIYNCLFRYLVEMLQAVSSIMPEHSAQRWLKPAIESNLEPVQSIDRYVLPTFQRPNSVLLFHSNRYHSQFVGAIESRMT